MEIFANSLGSPLVVNAACAAIALAIGFAAGAWVCGLGEERDPHDSTDEKDELQSRIEQERSIMASDRLRELATMMASDVGAHSASIGQIEARLMSNNGAGGDPTPNMIMQALAEIGSANSALRGRLEEAERQIETQAEQIRSHETQALTDSLTGLANRRAFDAEMDRRFAEWDRYRTPFSLLIIDVDHFKSFNDTHGHQAGDEVLRSVGAAIAHSAREMDVACRYGGEEFALILPATEAIDADVVAERVRESIEAIRTPFENKALSVTASVGLAGALPADNVSLLVRRADDALYTSKDAGRNNCHRHTGKEVVPVTNLRSAEQSNVSTQPAETQLLDRLPNRTRFFELLRGELRNAEEAGTTLAIMTVRFAEYRKLASEFGPAVADLTLDSIAQFIDNALHEEDKLARLDDGQFLVLLPNQNQPEATAIAGGIGEALAGCTIPLGQSELKLAVGMGVVALQADDTVESMLSRAEKSLKLAQTSAVPMHF